MNNNDFSGGNPEQAGSADFLRRDFLKMVGGACAIMAAEGAVNLWPLQAAPAAAQRNVIIFLTDQQRALQWFPTGWAAANLPFQSALAATGVTFNRAYTNTAMCTPARTTLFTGLYPAQHLSANTLSEGNVQSEEEHQLNPTYPNVGSVLTAAGYEVAYIGKYHLSKGIIQENGVNIWDDIERYSFTQWDPPDAGRNTALGDYGGGFADHDGRYIQDALAFLQNRIDNPGGKPFCLVISLVNPHDLLGYPLNLANGGYIPSQNPDWEGNQWLADKQGVSINDADWTADTVPPIELPPTVGEDLSTNFKPTVQEAYLQSCAGLGPLPTPDDKRKYLNFYGNLMSYTDYQFNKILQLLDSSPAGIALRANTWMIRTSDHGEYGMAHGGLRQKSFTIYEEALRVPLIWSNPTNYPFGSGQQCNQLVGHVDFLPTLCSMLGINPKQYRFSGTDYSSLISNPGTAPAVQDYILFTYDDIWCGQNAQGYPNGVVPAPNRIRAIRELDYAYAYYFDGQGVEKPQTEFYDLRNSAQGGTDCDPRTGEPVEMKNLSAWAYQQGQTAPITRDQVAKRTSMANKLQQAVRTKLKPLPVQPAVPPENFTIGQVNWTDEYGQQAGIQITWISRSSTIYELQMSTDNTRWTTVGAPITGNNGPIIITQPLTGLNVSYRLAWRPNPNKEFIVEPSKVS
jgi:arylsulfatase A-like enzyme